MVKSSCTSSKQVRTIERNQHAHCYEQNRENLKTYAELYKRRQAIVEHPFGTIKRQWGFDYILTKKGMNRASADVGFIFIAYNLRRIINIIGFKALMAYFKACIAKITQTGAPHQLLEPFTFIFSYVSFKFSRMKDFLTYTLLLNSNLKLAVAPIGRYYLAPFQRY